MMHKKWQTVLIAALMLIPATAWAQTGGFSGTIPATFSILNTSNATLAGTIPAFTLTIGQNTLAHTDLEFRLRSNAPYKLTASVGSLSNIATGTQATADNTARSITLGDVGFGISAITGIDGAEVVGGGGSPSRTDTIASAFDLTAGLPSPSGGSVTFNGTLHDIESSTQILTGDRISASGDNSSSDNFLQVKVTAAILPQYFGATSFTGTVTFTIATQ